MIFLGRCLILLLAAAWCLSACAPLRPAATVTGEIGRDQVWTGTIHVAGDVTIPAGVTVTVTSGSRVLFDAPPPGTDLLRDHPNFPGSELIVKGSLRAEGTPGAPILFAYADPAAPPGSWGGINLSGSPGSLFTYCRFRQADSAVHSQESRVTIRESVFRDNLVGIRFFSSPITIEHNLLAGNRTAIRFHYGAPVIRFNRIAGNRKGLFITAEPRDYRIESNDILDNAEFAVVLGEEVSGDVAMPGNFWGTFEPGKVRPLIFDRGRVDYLGAVRILPLAGRPVPGAGPTWSR